MVKGISRQVILVRGPETKLFEQAIFILKDDAVREGVTEEALLREAKQIVSHPPHRFRLRGPIWAAGGAAMTGLCWLLTTVL